MQKKVITLGFIVLWIVFIYFNSLQIGAVSGEVSGNITQWLASVLNQIGIQVDVVDLSVLVRKGAHVGEFLVLGLLLMLYQFQSSGAVGKRFINVVVFGLMVAVVDEVIQTFIPGRSGLIIDVLIDLIGIALACGVGLIVVLRRGKQ
jgi:VanZ family protein